MKLNKKQKRTATIASMAALLAVVLGMGGQTFAKYITTNTVPAQTATVAKWGYVINLSTDSTDTFKTAYDTADGTVQSLSSDKKVAPGTSGSMTINIDGQAEVKSEVKFEFTGTTKDVYLKNDASAYYYPVKWTVEKSGEADPVVEGTLANVETYFENGGAALLTNNAKADVNVTYTISWAWAFEGTETINMVDPATGEEITVNAADTYLGNYEAGMSLPTDWSANTTISFGINVSVAQVD